MTTLAGRRAGSRAPLDLEFTTWIEVRPDGAAVCFAGELDLSSHELCRRSLEEIAAATDGAIVLDLTELSFIDGAGVVLLVESARRLSATRPARLELPPRGPIRRAFGLVRR